MLSKNIRPETEILHHAKISLYLWEILFFWAFVQLIDLLSTGNNYQIGRNILLDYNVVLLLYLFQDISIIHVLFFGYLAFPF